MLIKSDRYWHVMPNPKSRQNPFSFFITWNRRKRFKSSIFFSIRMKTLSHFTHQLLFYRGNVCVIAVDDGWVVLAEEHRVVHFFTYKNEPCSKALWVATDEKLTMCLEERAFRTNIGRNGRTSSGSLSPASAFKRQEVRKSGVKWTSTSQKKSRTFCRCLQALAPTSRPRPRENSSFIWIKVKLLNRVSLRHRTKLLPSLPNYTAARSSFSFKLSLPFLLVYECQHEIGSPTWRSPCIKD